MSRAPLRLIKAPVKRAAPDTLRGLYDAGRKRKQNILTPDWFLEAVREAFGGTIPLDPCASRNQRHWFAHDNWIAGGRSKAWEDKAFANPPYFELALWLRWAQSEAARSGLPTIVLGPWRSHRVNFLQYVAGAELVYFRAFPFEGQKNTAPFPCFAAIRHCTFPVTPYEVGRGHVTVTAQVPRARGKVARG